MKGIFENFTILIGSIIIGIPLGFIVGLVCWFRLPFQVYVEARSKLAIKRIQRAEEFIEQYKKDNSNEGMWERHIQRIKEKESYDN